MPKQIYVEPNIQDLVRGLNQIQGVKTLQSCDGHGGTAWITFACPPSMGIVLFRLAMKHKGVGIRKFSIGKPESGMAYLSIQMNPRWASKTILEMQSEFLQDLEKSGLKTEACQFEILSPVSIAETKTKWQPDFEQALILMTADKFELIKNFLYARWYKRLESYMNIRRLPNLSGNIKSGKFYCRISYKRHVSKNLIKFNGVLWDVRWREYKMLMSLHEHYYNNPFKWGIPLSEEEAVILARMTSRGASMSNLVRAGRLIGLELVGMRLNLDELIKAFSG